MDIVSYDGDANGSNYLQTKVSCSTAPARAGRTSSSAPRTTRPPGRSTRGFAAPLNKGLVPQATLAGSPRAPTTPARWTARVYCLRNDLAQAVLWYNAPLMKKLGYQVPTTWEEYQALGEKVATEHPGYLVGAAGDAFTPEIYLWASKCGANHITGPKSVTVNTTERELHADGHAAGHPDQEQDHVHEQRVQLRLRQEPGRQGPA